MIHNIPYPRWLFLLGYRYGWLFNLGFFAAMIGLLVIAYKIRSTPGNEFKQRLLWFFYTGAFFCGVNVFIFHPYYTQIYSMLAGVPHLCAILNLALFTIRKYGIGGNYDTQEDTQPGSDSGKKPGTHQETTILTHQTQEKNT